MKNLQILSFALIATFLLAGCSSNDDNDGGDYNNDPIIGNYFPSVANNLWIYDVENTSSTNPEIDFDNESDFLKVNTATGNTFTLQVDNNNNDIPYGTMNEILSAGTLTMGESTLSYSGSLELPDEFSQFSNQTISLQNVLLYDLNASNNSVLTEVSDTIEEQLMLAENTVPLVIDYTLTTKKISTSNSMTVSGESYSNVIKTRLELNVTIYVVIPVLGNMNVISNQDVLVIDNYFAEDIGLIKSEAEQSYDINQAFLDVLNSFEPPIDLGIATTFQVENVQELDDYLFN